jgi:hypothetical protein
MAFCFNGARHPKKARDLVAAGAALGFHSEPAVAVVAAVLGWLTEPCSMEVHDRMNEL